MRLPVSLECPGCILRGYPSTRNSVIPRWRLLPLPFAGGHQPPTPTSCSSACASTLHASCQLGPAHLVTQVVQSDKGITEAQATPGQARTNGRQDQANRNNAQAPTNNSRTRKLRNRTAHPHQQHNNPATPQHTQSTATSNTSHNWPTDPPALVTQKGKPHAARRSHIVLTVLLLACASFRRESWCA